MLKKSFYSLIIRFLTIVVRFFFLVFFAKELGTDDLGKYGLIVITVTLFTHLIGFDFYQFNTRELLSKENVINLIYNQFVLHLFSYLLLIPILLSVSFFITLDFPFYILIILLLSEHLSQEINRLMITLQSPILSNMILFIRNGSWVVVIVIGYYLNYLNASLYNIILAWLFGSLLSAIIGILILIIILRDKIRNPFSLQKSWILLGLKSSLYFFGTSLLLKGIEFSDRYFIQFFHSEEEVGIYTFYFSIANILNTFVITGSVSILYPTLISSFKSKDYFNYRRIRNLIKQSILASIIVLSIILSIGIDVLIELVNKDEIKGEKGVFYLILLFTGTYLLGLVPQYDLYVHQKDKVFLKINVYAFGICVITNFAFVPLFGGYGAAISTFLAFLFLTTAKFYFAQKFTESFKELEL